MTALFWLLLAFFALVFGILIYELKNAPIVDPTPDDFHERDFISSRLRDHRAVRALRAQKFEETK